MRCTQKLLRLLGEKPGDISDVPEGLFSEWYANLVWIDRRKCILFTDSKSLYSFLVPDVRKKELADFSAFFRMHLLTSLAYLGLDLRELPVLSTESTDLCFARTRDRVVLGCMNEIAFTYKWWAASSGGLANVDVSVIDRKVNDTPMSPLEHVTPLNTLAQQLRGLAI